MKIRYLFLLILAVFFILVLILNFIGLLSNLNQPLNNLIAGKPNKNCNLDSDCNVKPITCYACDCGDAVNKNWKPICIFQGPKQLPLCKPCPTPDYHFKVKCLDNICTRAWRNA